LVARINADIKRHLLNESRWMKLRSWARLKGRKGYCGRHKSKALKQSHFPKYMILWRIAGQISRKQERCYTTHTSGIRIVELRFCESLLYYKR
jgi:hypothetical protein